MPDGERRRHAQGSAKAMPRIIQRRGQIGRVVVKTQGQCQQRVIEGLRHRIYLRACWSVHNFDAGVLDYRLNGCRQARAHTPDTRQLAAQGGARGLGSLVVGLQLLLNGRYRKLQRLISMQELRDEVFDAGIVARTRRIAAAEVDDRRGEGQLLRVAKHVSVSPSRAAAAAQIARIGRTQGYGMPQPLDDLECDRNATRFVGLCADLYIDLPKD